MQVTCVDLLLVLLPHHHGGHVLLWHDLQQPEVDSEEQVILVFMLIFVLYEDKVILLQQWDHGPIHCSQIYETDSNASNPVAPGNPRCQIEFEVN